MKRILLLMTLFCSLRSVAQFPSYCIYLMSGDVTVTNKGKKPEKARLNQFLNDSQELTITGKAQLTLINRDSKYLVLNSPGTYKVNTLSNNLKNYPPGVTQKYLSLLWKDMVASQDNFSSVKKSAASGVIGGVHRGNDCGELIFPSPGLHSSEEQLRFIWKARPKALEYTLVLMDDRLNEIFSRQLTDTQTTIQVSKDLSGRAGNMFWTVRIRGGNACEIDPVPFELFSKETEEKIFSGKEDFYESADLISRLSVIDRLEKDGWVYRAFHFFDLLLKANPGNRLLSRQYAMLLLHYGFSKEAEDLYNQNQGQ